MRTIAAAKLVDMVAAIMRGGGCDAHEATLIARRLVDSPEFKARIDAARAAGEAARAMVDSPEFKAQMARIREDNAEMRREMAEWRAREKASATPTP